MLVNDSAIIKFAKNYIETRYFFEIDESRNNNEQFFLNKEIENNPEPLCLNKHLNKITSCEVISAFITHKFRHSVKVAVKAKVYQTNLDEMQSNEEKVFLGIRLNEQGYFHVTSSLWCAPFLAERATSEYELNQTPTWYLLVDTAYDRWQDDDLKDSSYEEFLDALTTKQRQAVLLMSLSVQVSNGGFQQWVENGYATKINEVIDILNTINKPASLKVANMLDRIIKYIRTDIKKPSFSDYYWSKGSSFFWQFVKELNFRYYELSQTFESEIEEFLRQAT